MGITAYEPFSNENSQESELVLVRLAQCFLPDNFLSLPEYKTLSVFYDKGSQVYRVGGRLDKALVSYDQRHPVLLPKSHWFTKLVIKHAHQYGGHCGVNSTCARVKRKYWSIGAQRLAKSEIHKCVICHELNENLQEQVMAELPADRLNTSPPFYYCNLDFFDPIVVKHSRRTTAKTYGVIFSCQVTRAVYID